MAPSEGEGMGVGDRFVKELGKRKTIWSVGEKQGRKRRERKKR